MIRYFIPVFILIFSSVIPAQDYSKAELDSMYNLFLYFKGVNVSENMKQNLNEHPEVFKCGMGLVTSLKQNFSSFSVEQQNVLSKILDRPADLPNTAVSSNGFFRIHYTTTGNNAIGYDINLLLAALDSVYSFEIDTLGYPVPPSDGSAGDDDKYDIYIQNLGGLYGYTWFENKAADSRWTSYMVIDNDFVGYYSTGINGARVTVAHEFHHAIQAGNYAPQNYPSPYRNDDLFFYELTSTSMEEFVFDYVNDYYSYMHSYFQHPEKAMPMNDGYSLAIWNIYLQKNFGYDILKNQWERMPVSSAVKSIAMSISHLNSTLRYELSNFGVWCYFTGSRAISGRYFEEANYYPLITPTAVMNFNSAYQTYNLNLYPTSNYYLRINLPDNDGMFYSIISNTDWQSAEITYNQTKNASFTIYHDANQGEKNVSENYSVTLTTENNDSSFWNHAGILNNVVVYGGTSGNAIAFDNDTRVFPNPYKLSSVDPVTIEFKHNLLPGSEVDISIFSAGLELYYSGKKTIAIVDQGINQVKVNKAEINLSSGVYIYIIKSGDNIFKGKLAIFND